MSKESIHWHVGGDNDACWKLLEQIKATAKPIKSIWSGDYLKSFYRKDNIVYVVWENMDLGIMSEIEIYKDVDKEVADRYFNLLDELDEIRNDESYGTDSSMGERCYKREKELLDSIRKIREGL